MIVRGADPFVNAVEPLPMAYEAEIRILDRSSTMVIDMNESKLKTIEQIREFLTGTADVTFTVPVAAS
jgi:hypothetical protein